MSDGRRAGLTGLARRVCTTWQISAWAESWALHDCLGRGRLGGHCYYLGRRDRCFGEDDCLLLLLPSTALPSIAHLLSRGARPVASPKSTCCSPFVVTVSRSDLTRRTLEPQTITGGLTHGATATFALYQPTKPCSHQ